MPAVRSSSIRRTEPPTASSSSCAIEKSRPITDLTPEDVTAWIREAAGDPALDPRIESIACVEYGVDVAARFRDRSAFLLGDAAHRVSPRGANGLNTAIRDGFDLGWKLASCCADGQAKSCFDSYEAERRPVAEHNAARSADPNGSERAVTDELRADLGGRIAHLWLPGSRDECPRWTCSARG
jgi:putative polyketide hydroxylase